MHNRFMTNRIPFIDASEGTPVEKYYMEDPNYPKEDGTGKCIIREGHAPNAQKKK